MVGERHIPFVLGAVSLGVRFPDVRCGTVIIEARAVAALFKEGPRPGALLPRPASHGGSRTQQQLPLNMNTAETLLPNQERQGSVNFSTASSTAATMKAEKAAALVAAKRAGASLPLYDAHGALGLGRGGFVVFLPQRVDKAAGMVFGSLAEHGGTAATAAVLPFKDLARGLRACKERTVRRTRGPLVAEVVHVDKASACGVITQLPCNSGYIFLGHIFIEWFQIVIPI